MNNETDAESKLSLLDHAVALKTGGMRCNCDLDNWQPEPTTRHTHVCRIHKAAMAAFYYPKAAK